MGNRFMLERLATMHWSLLDNLYGK